MRTVLIIHGIGGHAGIHWQQWLHDELGKVGYSVLMPDLPNSDHPDRQTWLNDIKRVLKGCNTSELTIVGHSLGVTTALDYIEQAESEVGGLVAVSGFVEEYGLELNEYFLKEKKLKLALIKDKLRWANVVYGSDDPYVTQKALKQVADGLEVEPVVIESGGHLNTDTGFTQFPALLSMIKREN